MARIGEQQFFALQRLKDAIDMAERRRIKVEDLCFIDHARKTLETVMEDGDAKLWASSATRCASRLNDQGRLDFEGEVAME